MTEQAQEQQQLDRKDLKIIALKDRVSEEAERNADLRAELTMTISAANEQIQALVEENAELRAKLPEEEDNEVSTQERPDASDSDK